MPSKFRYDPLYRVIEEVAPFQKIEGSYRELFQRIKEINNLGIIPRVFEMAKYPKYEHSIGTLHQVQNLIDLAGESVIRKEYQTPLITAASFLHTGHLPFTYSTERSLLFASNLGDRESPNKIGKYIRGRLDSVFDHWDIDEDREEAILDDLLSMRDCNSLYKFFSANQLVRRWASLKKKINELSEGDLEIAIKDLVDKKNDGYRYLDLANRADYVQRDALYFGTVRIDISPKHLYGEMSEYTPRFSVSEEKLIEANLDYLKERFYENHKVIGYSRLYEKIVASMMLSTNFKLKWLEEYDDSQFERLITFNRDKKNNPAKLPERWVKRAKKLLDPSEEDFDFDHVFSLRDVPIGMDAIDVEYELLEKGESKRGLLRYPFTDGILLSIDFESESRSSPFIGDETYESHTIQLFQDRSNRSFTSLLKIIKNLSPYLSLSNVAEIRRSVAKQFSWTGAVRFENERIAANTQVLRAISSAIGKIHAEDDQFIKNLFTSLRELKSYSSLWRNFENEFWLLTYGNIPTKGELLDLDKESTFRGIAQGILSLPVELLQFKAPSENLHSIRSKLIEMIAEDEFEELKCGDLFEAVCLIDLITKEEGQFQFFLNGMVIYDPNKRKGKRDVNEYDVIELRINDDGNAECWIHACSIADNYVDKDRDKVTSIAHHIHDNEFPQLGISTCHAVPTDKGDDNWKPKYENAGTNY